MPAPGSLNSKVSSSDDAIGAVSIGYAFDGGWRLENEFAFTQHSISLNGSGSFAASGGNQITSDMINLVYDIPLSDTVKFSIGGGLGIGGYRGSLRTTGTSFDANRPVFDKLTAFERGGTNVGPGLASSWDVTDGGKTLSWHVVLAAARICDDVIDRRHVDHVLQKLPYNEEYFARAFRRYMGLTPQQYQQAQRLERAREALATQPRALRSRGPASVV